MDVILNGSPWMSWSHHYKAMAKYWNPSFLKNTQHICAGSYHLSPCFMTNMHHLIGDSHKGHLRTEVFRAHQQFLHITFDYKELETWDCCQYVRLGKTHRLICNMTYLGHHVTLTWLELRLNFDLDLSWLNYILRRRREISSFEITKPSKTLAFSWWHSVFLLQEISYIGTNKFK